MAAPDRIAAIRKALSHPQFYDGDIGADIRWLLDLVGRPCLCLEDDPLVREWMQKVREVALARGVLHERCDGRYPVPHKRDEPFEVTYRCALRLGHSGPHGSGDRPEPVTPNADDRPKPMCRHPYSDLGQCIDCGKRL